MAYPGVGDNGTDDNDGNEELEPWGDEEQLTLADEDQDLPWLEADEYEDEGGFDWRLIGAAALGLVVVFAALAALWWFGRESGDPEYVADGSTIAAPEGPYKQRPDDPGGRQVAGTGDQAFEVAEGESRGGRMSDEEPSSSTARPSIDREQSGSSDPAPSADEAGAVYVQIGAYSSRSDAEEGWRMQAQRYSVLSGVRHRVKEADVNGARVYRLQAISGDRASADATCRAIRDAGGACYIR